MRLYGCKNLKSYLICTCLIKIEFYIFKTKLNEITNMLIKFYKDWIFYGRSFRQWKSNSLIYNTVHYFSTSIDLKNSKVVSLCRVKILVKQYLIVCILIGTNRKKKKNLKIMITVATTQSILKVPAKKKWFIYNSTYRFHVLCDSTLCLSFFQHYCFV